MPKPWKKNKKERWEQREGKDRKEERKKIPGGG